MPDFDKNLNPIYTHISTPDMPSQLSAFVQPTMPKLNFDDFYKNYSANGLPVTKEKNIFDVLAKYDSNATSDVSSLLGTSHKTLNENQRYDSYHPDLDLEDMYGQGQGFISKATSGVLKGLNLAGTTVLSTGAMIGGVGKAITTGRIADIWDNEATRAMDAWNVKVDQEYLPNYYANKETDAKWYSSDNWMTWNFLFDKVIKNSGFMAGAMVTDRFMFSALGKAGSLIGEAASIGEKAIEAKTAAQAAKAVASGTLESVEAYQKSKIIAPLLNKIARGFSQGKNIEVANELEKGISSIADLEARKSALEVINASRNSFAYRNIEARKILTATYSSSGEALFEALNTTTEHRNNLVKQYQDTHGGLAPIGEDLKEINKNSDDVGKTSFIANMAVLSITEYAQLPNLLGSSYNAEKQLANSLMGKVGKTVIENGVHVAKPLTKFNKIFSSAKRVGSYVFDLKEGTQEILQTGIQVGTQNYFNKKHETNDADILVDGFLYGFVGKDKTGKDVGALISKEGLEGGIIGGLTGGLTQARQTHSSYKEKESNTKEFLKQINNAPTFKEAFKDKIDFANRGIVLQKQKQDAIIQGDKLEAKDLLTDATLNYIAPRVKYGRTDMITSDIADMRKLSATSEGLAVLKESGHAAEDDTKESFNVKLNEFKKTTKAVETFYNSLNSRYAGEVLTDKEGNIIKDVNGNPQRKYSPEIIDKMVYAASKVSNYDLRIPLVNNSLAKANVNTLEVLENIIEKGKPNIETIDKALSDIDKSNNIDKDKLKQNLSDVIELNLRRNQFLKEYDDLKNNPENFKTVEPTVTDEEGNVLDEKGNIISKETITVKVKDGKTGQVVDKKIEIGTQYLLGKVVKYDKHGNEVIQDPVLIILADNGDGTYKIKDKNGIRNVSAQVLEDYQLSKLSDITSDKKKNYVYVNRNNTFSNKLIKDSNGKPVIGRLEYTANKDKLIFAYKNEKGKVIRSEVWNNMFKAKEGFKEAIISKVGEYTAEEQQAAQEFVDAVTTISQKLQTRNNIILDLYEKSTKRVEEVSRKLVSTKEQFIKNENALNEQLAKESLTKAGKPRVRQTPVMKKIINSLADLRNNVAQEIETLKNEKEELESNIPFFKDFLDNLETLPESGREMINLLKSDINTLKDLIDITNQAIKDNTSLLKQIEDAFLKAVSIFNDFIKRLQQENKGVPLFIDNLQSNLEKVLGEEGAHYYIDNKQGITSQVLELESDINDFNEELKIPELNKKAEELVNDIKELKEGLDKLINEQTAKQEILNAFEQFAEDVKKQEEEEKQMQRNVVLGQELLGTLTNSVQNFFGTRPYEAEAKKDKLDVVGSTRPFTEDTKDRPLPGYAARVNHFGARVSDMDNVDDLRGVIVTAETQEQILPGLVDMFLAEVPNLSPEKIKKYREESIFLVVTEKGQLVDKDGKVIPGKSTEETDEAYYKRLYNNALFQVFPAAELTSNIDGKKQSMFRDSVPQYERDSLKEQYKAWRESQLSNKNIDRKGQKFKTSFGNLEFAEYKDSQGNILPDATRTPVQQAGLLAKGILNRDAVITVATTNDDKSEGRVSFKSPKGRVFLRIPGQGLVKLFNKKFSKTESEVIFDAMLNLAKNASANGSLYGNEKEEVNKNILNWLKSVVYWGIAKYPDGTRKPAGYNNIWFEDVLVEGKQVKKLFMSGLQKESKKYFDFTPQGLINSKQDILGLLTQMYANTDAKKVNIDTYNTPYNEIIRFDNLGNPVIRTWSNYQTYLLSENIVDSKGNVTGKRTGKEIPLTTQIRPLTSPEDTNRKGVYFTLNSSVEYNVPAAPVVKPVVATTPVTQAPQEDKPVVKQQQPTAPGKFKLDGQGENSIVIGGKLDKNGNITPIYNINFTFDISKISDYLKGLKDFSSLYDENKTLTGEFLNILASTQAVSFFKNENGFDSLTKTIQNNKNITEEQAKKDSTSIALNKVFEAIAPQVVAEMIPVQPAIADEAPVVEAPVVQPEIPVSDIEAKKADIEKIIDNFEPKDNFKSPVDSWGVYNEDAKGNSINEIYVTIKGNNYTREELLDIEDPENPAVQETLNEIDRLQKLLDEELATLEKNSEHELIGKEIEALEPTTKELIKGNVVSVEINKIKEGHFRLILDNGEKVAWNENKPDTFTWIKSNNEKENTTELPKKNISLRDRSKLNPNIRRDEMRVAQTIDQIKQFKPEQWNKVEEGISKMLPNIPLYRVKNIIKGTNGRQAWGMLHNAAIYVYEGAEEGTAYHEVFEAVWKMFAGPAQKQNIINEFKSRRGTFKDRESTKTVEYKFATPHQIKEQLAEEFRDVVLNDKLGKPKENKTLIGRLFSQLVDFIKAFFTGENAQRNTKELFNNIGNGYYAQFNPYQTQLSYANKGIIDIENAQADDSSELRSTTIPEIEMHDIIQHMTFLTLTRLSLNNKSVFTVSNPDEKILYPELQIGILSLLAEKVEITDNAIAEGKISLQEGTRYINNLETLSDNIQNEWEEIKKNHKAHLKTFDVQFDENDDDILSNDENTGRGEFEAANKIDSFRKSNAALKLVLSTIPVTQIVNGDINWEPSSIGGVKLIPADQIHIDLKAKLHSSLDIEDMLLGLKTMAENNPNYNALFRRLTGNSATVGLDIDTIEEHDFQLATALWQSISMQNPDDITVFLQEDGDVVVSNSTLNTAAKQAKKEMINDIISTLKNEESIYFRYVPSTGKYYAKDNLKALSFDGRDLKPYISFLKQLGINFNEREVGDLKEDQITAFKKAVGDIKNELSKVGDTKIVKDINNNDVEEDGGLRAINTKTLNIDGDLLRLAIVKAVIENTEFQSTYFNINGERTQSFIGTNLISALHNTLSKLKNIEELENDPRYKRFAYLTGGNDVFAQGSQVIKKMFDITGQDSTGKRRNGTEDILKPVIIDGIVDEQTGKKKEASKVSYRQRLILELNLNLSGIFMNLVPGDASLEHAIRMYNEKDPFVKEDQLLNKGYLDVFKDYFISEVELAKENRNTAKDNGKDLRFFKAILGEQFHKKIASKINKNTEAEQLYEDNKQEINSAVESFIKEEVEDTEQLLKAYDIITEEEGVLKVDKVNIFKKEEMVTQAGLNIKLKALSINYIISNIEMHKVMYSDPYQYNDELKRIKNFTSPGQPLVPSSQKVDSRLNKLYNKGFESNDIGYTDFTQDHFKTVTLADVWSTNENLGYEEAFEETDGGGLIIDKANRVFRLRAGTWSSDNERQFRYDVAFEKTIKGKDLTNKQKEELGLVISEEEKEIFKKGNPEIKDTYTPVKPIVRGNKQNGRTYNDIVLHKFALAPLSFRILYELNPNSNAIKLYNKMQKENMDYGVFASGGKVGNEKISPLYKANGEFDNTPFQDAKELKGNLPDNVKRAVSNIPFTIVAVQSEVPSKDNPVVTQGSQITKLATMDYLESGVPVDFMSELPTFEDRFAEWLSLKDKSSYNGGKNIYNEILNNQKLLEARIDDAVESLYKKLGIVESTNEEGEKEWKIEDKDKLVKTLTEEIGKREINYNIVDAFEGFVQGDAILEATPVYQQVRNILYSIADKTIVRPKISGGMKVQVSSALLESVRAEGKPVLDDKGNQVINKDGSLKFSYESKELAFYTKSENGKDITVCEIMIGRWFKSNKSDKELIDYFNNDPEGKKEFAAITGVAFRIPTQKQNSIDVFKIKQFLPKDFGDSVIIPSALVKKAGSDFDIDKLSIYLKNLFTDSQGKIRVVPFLGTGKEAKYKFEDLFYDTLDAKIDKKNAQILSQENLQTIFGEIAYGESTDKTRNKWIPIFREMFEDILVDDKLSIDEVENVFITKIEKLGKNINKLTNVDLQTILAQDFVDSMYKQSLENAYIQSLEDLISHPLNYDNLVKPNDADPLKKLSVDIQREMGYEKADFGNVGNMLSRKFMSGLRQSFVGGKQALGIAAQGQVGHAQRQRSVTYIDVDRLEGDLIDEQDKIILGYESNSSIFATDTDINFQEYNSAVINGVKRPMLSWIKNKAGEYISDINGMFIDGYVDISKGDWIIKLGATTNVASTWLFLTDLGVPIKTVAYFMNQPIIRDYLRTIENKGYSWLYIDDIIENKLADYSPSKEFLKSAPSVKGIPTEVELYKTLKYNNASPKSEMTDIQKLQQQYMLKEFLKYAKMSSHMFNVSQASNYDTANINDPYLVFKKIVQLEKAKRTIISSVDDIIEGSFVRNLKNKIFDYRDAFAEILMSDRGNVRQMLQNVLTPYVDMSDRDFVKLSQKAVNDLFDWAVQTNSNVNTKIASILLGTETEKSAAEQIIDYKDSILGNPVKGIAPKPEHKLFNNIILNSLSIDQDNKKGGKKNVPINLVLDNRENKVFDQNLTIYGFNELRETLREENNLKLYGKLTRLALLQSGLNNSPISFTNLLPYNDFKGMYNETLSILENLPNLAKFQELNVFERKNWSNSDVAVYKRETNKKMTKDDGTFYMFKPDTKLVDSLTKAVNNKTIPKLIGLSPMSEAGRKDFVVFTYETPISSEQRILRRKNGNNDHQHKILMQKVYTTDKNKKRIPLTQISEDGKYTKYIYKAINAWGDSFRAQEFYDVKRESVLDNGFDKVSNEVEDDVIVGIYKGSGSTTIETLSESKTEKPKGVKVKDGIYVNQEALTKEEQLELFDYLKPFLEEQGAKTNKSPGASKMIGLGLRWDYKSNNPGKQAINIPDVINPGNKTKYGYYNSSINNQPLAPITSRFRELMQKATGVDMTNYDGAIINLYEKAYFISSHNDVDESRSAIGYPVIGINIGGTGNFSIESRDGEPKQLELKAGASYIFGVDGINRDVYHRTSSKPVNSFLPMLTTKIDGKTYEPGSYRVTITMRRVMPLELDMPSKPNIAPTPAENENTIYSKLGNKTVSGNVIIKPLYQQAGVQYAKDNNAVFSLRVNNSNEHFGNPFSSVPTEIEKGLVPTNSTKESVEKYIDWILNGVMINEDDNLKYYIELEKRRRWVREQLQSGELKDKPIVYYKELGEPSHATALDYLINKYDWSNNNQNVNEKPEGTINVYWGQPESATSTKILSNLAPRKFNYESVDGISREYGSVEHAYQSNKNGKFDKAIYDAYVTKGGYGVKIAPKLTEVGKRANLQIMKDLVVESFIQNPNSEASKKLLQYKNFTHNTNELIDQAFLEGLKLAQRELLNNKSKGVILKDNKTYNADQLNTKMLMSMGYNLIEAGEIIKNNKC